MNVRIDHGKEFTPFTVSLEVQSFEEAAALRAVYGGGRTEILQRICTAASKYPTTADEIREVHNKLGRAVDAELVRQGYRG